MPTATPLLLSIEQVAQQLNVGRTTAYRLIQEGIIPSVKIGRLRRVPVNEVARYVESQLEEQA